MNWIKKVLKAVENTESPRAYFHWSLLCAISAVARKNVWLPRGGAYKLYPNIYVFLIGRSGLRKGLPVSIAKKLVLEADCTRVIWGRASFQGIIKEISNATTLSSGLVLDTAQAFIASGEFAGSLVRDEDALTFFTDIYNTHEHEPKWEGFLKSETKTILKEPCITWLGASNEVHFRDKVDSKNVEGGLIARSVIVAAEKKYKHLSLMSLEEKEDVVDDLVNIKEHAKYLKEISKMKGPFTYDSQKTRVDFDRWYIDFSKKVELDNNDPTGTLQRIHDQILKVAMLISMSYDTNKIITGPHIEEAKEMCFDTIPGMQRTTMGKGLSESSESTALVLKALLSQADFRMGRKRLLREGWGNFDSVMLDRVVETLLQAGIIKVNGGSDPIYIMKEEAVEKYMSFKKEVQ